MRGAIDASGPGDPPILFQVNLPSVWNRKTVQHGGAGLNGVVVEATSAFAGGGGVVAPALARGYVTYGSDSGHQTPGVSFFANPQALSNYAYEAVKRTKDLSTALAKTYYGTAPVRNYHIGGSKGGQEGLQATQRYAADFDGVVAYYPAAQTQSLQIGWNRLWHFAFNTPGGALNTAEQTLLKRAVMTACDRLDGVADQVVSNTAGCARAFDVTALRCPTGRDAGDGCLSDVQITALNVAGKAFDFAYPMPNGVRSVGPWPVFIGGELQTWFGDGSDGSQQEFYRGPAVRPEALASSGVDQATWRADILGLATIYDASNPDIDAFQARAGKLIIVQGTTDMLVPEPMTTTYVDALIGKYGARRLREFVRYYVVPGYGHGGDAFKAEWDALAAIDTWVESGRAPDRPVVTDGAEPSRSRTRPLCEHPNWPKFVAGDETRAESYVCAKS